MVDNWSNRVFSRRRVLKASALGIGIISGVSGIAVAEENEFKRTIQKSHEVLNTKGLEAKVEFLKANGIGVAQRFKRVNLSPNNGSHDKFATTQDDDFNAGDDATFYFHLYEDCNQDYRHDGTYTAELGWNYDAGAFRDEPPEDAAQLTWGPEEAWRKESRNFYESTYTSDYVYFDEDTEGYGPGFRVQDEYDESNTGWWYCGLYLEPTGHDDPDSRGVSGEYLHTWTEEGEPEISSVGVSYPWGITVNLTHSDDEIGSEDIERDEDGNGFRLYQDQATECRSSY
jgi:hypothetical protein